MLTGAEWQVVERYIRTPKGRKPDWQGACDRYEELTGYKGASPSDLYEHRISLFGPPCHA